MSSRKLAAFFGFASSLLCAFAHAQTPKSDVPLKVTFCDLYSDPKRYSGEMIQVRAAILGYRDPTLEEPMFNPIQPCAASGYLNFGLELPQDVKPMPEFGFVEDESYQKYKEALKSHVQIEATLEGRFDVVFIWRNHRRERLAEGQGFGKKHDKDARLVLHRVLDVETRRVPPL